MSRDWRNTWFVLLAEPPVVSSIATFELPIGLSRDEVWAEVKTRWPEALGFRSFDEPWTKPDHAGRDQ